MYRAIGLMGLLLFVRFFRITGFRTSIWMCCVPSGCLWGMPQRGCARQCMKEGFDSWG